MEIENQCNLSAALLYIGRNLYSLRCKDTVSQTLLLRCEISICCEQLWWRCLALYSRCTGIILVIFLLCISVYIDISKNKYMYVYWPKRVRYLWKCGGGDVSFVTSRDVIGWQLVLAPRSLRYHCYYQHTLITGEIRGRLFCGEVISYWLSL